MEQAIAELAAVPDHLGYRFEGELGDLKELPYVELARQTARVAGALQASGLKRGDRVGLILPKNEQFIVAFLGAIRGGFVPAPISPPMGFGGTGPYLRIVSNLLDGCEAAALLTDAKLCSLLAPLTQSRPRLALVTFEALEDVGHFAPPRASMDDLCFVQFTSGSTGQRRGITIRHANVAANVRAIAWAFRERGLELGVSPGVWWLPLFHDMGLIGSVLCPLYMQNPIRMLTPLTFLKRPHRWLRAISEARGAVSFAPNFAYAQCARRLRPADLEGLDLSCWKLAGCGAEPIRPGDLRAFARILEPVGFEPKALACSYGMAEATLAVSLQGPPVGVEVDRVNPTELQTRGRAVPAAEGEPAIEIAACGGPILDMDIAIFDPSERRSAACLPERTEGEIRVRGTSVTHGYLGAPSDDPELFADGWLCTGDRGYVANGRIHITGRLKDTLIIHGRNHRPQDVEWSAAEVDGVVDRKAAAICVPGDGGDQVVVLVETLATAGLAQRRIAQAVKREVFEAMGLGGIRVVPVPRGSLPMTSSGKLRRFRARELYLEGALGSVVRA